MDDKAELTTIDRVNNGVEIFAKIETGLRNAADGFFELRELAEQGYAAGDLSGGDALRIMDECLMLAGRVGGVKADTLKLHEDGTAKAKARGVDVVQPYAELPEREVTDRSGSDR